MNLIYKHEKPLFTIAAIIAGIFWVSLILGTLGMALIFLLLAYVFFLFAQSAFITHIKGTGVKITEQQYPDLHQKLIRNCENLGVRETPEAYLLRTDFFNALATRFLGRNFVVLFTDVVDALDTQPGAVDFYIGHELGHIHRKHLQWVMFLAPASILPVLGTALRRAEEYTCDRYGVACCESEEDIVAAIAAIAAGDTRWKTINVDAYLEQVSDTNGFWMSFNELTSDYPWLTKRMATSLSLSRGSELKHPRRHLMAWILSLFVPRVGTGGVASVFVTIAMIGILAAIAIPAYQDYTERARHQLAYTEAQVVKEKVTEYVIANQSWPGSMQELGYENGALLYETHDFSIDIYTDGVVGAKMGTDAQGNDQYVVLEPSVEEGVVSWRCYGQDAVETVLPKACR